jgi:hypothetical protein
LFRRSIGFVECAVLAGKGHVGQHVVLAGVHQVGKLRPSRAQLLGHLAPGFAGMGAVGLVEGLPDRGGDNGVLAARDMGESIAHPVNAAALPVRAFLRTMYGWPLGKGFLWLSGFWSVAAIYSASRLQRSGCAP